MTLLKNYKTYAPTFDLGPLGGKEGVFYTRLSCNIYNELEDYIYVGKCVLEIIKKHEE